VLHLKFSTQLALPERQLRRAATSKGTDARGGSWPDLLREDDDDARRSGRRREECAVAATEDPRSAASSALSQDQRIKSLDSGSACKWLSAKTKGENEIKIGEKNVCMQGDSSHLGLVLRFPSPASIPQVPPSPPSPNPRGSRKSEMARWMRDERETVEREWGQEWTRRRVLCLSETWDQ